MKISKKLRIVVISIILVLSSTQMIVVNLDIVENNKLEIKEIEIEEFKKAQQKLHNYIDIATQTINEKVHNSKNMQYLQKKYGNELKNIIDGAEALIERRITQYENGEISLNRAQSMAAEDIKLLRYANGTGYIWINDTTLPFPKMIMHPTAPTLDGVVLDNKKYNVAQGKKSNLFTAAVEVSLKNGEGFVDYLWPKPSGNGLTSDQPKLSYVRLVSKWNWVIGTGIYIDDAVAEAQQESLDIIKSMRFEEGKGYFWINDNKSPIPKMIMHPISPGLDGKILNNAKYNKTKGSNTNLFGEMVKVVNANGSGYVEYMWPKPTGDNTTEEQPKLSYVEGIDEWGWIIGTGFYIDDIDKTINHKKELLKQQMIKLNARILIISIVSAVLLIVFATYFVSSILKPILKTSDMLKQISQGEGDLTQRLLFKSNDEIGVLSNHFNSFMEKLVVIISKVKNSSNKLLNIEKQLGARTDRASGEIEGINSLISGMKYSITDLNQTIEETEAEASSIIDSIHSLDNNIEDESTALEESSAAINEMVASINSVSNITNAKNESIKNLMDKTKLGGSFIDTSTRAIEEVYSQLEEIKSITVVIANISSQTNLLAMNAAIEAAHAGVYGKGFSVVANEIRNLAESSATSVSKITNLIEGVTSKIENSVDSSRAARKSFSDVDQEVTGVVLGLNEITQATEELAIGGNEILEAISLLNKISCDVQLSSSEIMGMTNSMKGAMNKAMKTSENVMKDINDVYNSSKKISDEVSEIVEYNMVLTETSDQLGSEIGQFKTE